MNEFQRIDKLKNTLDQQKPLPPEVVNNLKDVYKVEWTYHSNAIEGNTLSLMETKMVLEEGLTIGGKQLREHFEAINHAEAIDYIDENVSGQSHLDEPLLKSIHALILKNIDDKNAGVYRSINVKISGSEHMPPHFLQVEQKIKNLFEWYKHAKNKLHPVELAALFHFKFVYIHPFVDGNGRTARLLMNFILMQAGYPPAIVKAENEQRLNTIKL
ncbi:Fic/DOC family protein [Gracilibacillus orientalis]|uniref:Fic/DOC family protein n=1 Tax=Gracilibacillus orientalis TaxID=334253 RepID=A0A1I4GW52_9BACI|nr:Fic family protein [Gracilibacillus orientalis]SFL33780.1 Fic/DOC family protein [Gracilibacillus orientalis]